MKMSMWLMPILLPAAALFGLAACSDDDEMTPAGPVAGTANVRVIHASYDVPAVDILVDDVVGINALAFGQSSGYAQLSSGMRTIKVVPDGAATPVVIEADLDLQDGADYTIVAVGQLTSITALVEIDSRAPVASKAKVRFIHAVPDAPSVDVKLTTGTGPSLFTAQQFQDISGYQQIDAGAYTFAVTEHGSTAELSLYNPITVQAGMVYTVLAHGTLDPSDAYPFGVRVFVDNEAGDLYVDLAEQTRFANVRVIHTSYDAPTVDVLIDDGAPAAIANLAYGQSSGYNELESGYRNIKVVAAGTAGPAVIDANLTLVPNTDYTILAVGDLATIAPIFDTDERTVDPAMTRIRFVHAVPDAPAVDIKLNTGAGSVVFGNKAFQSISDYSTVAAGTYSFVVTAAGDVATVAEFEPVLVAAGSVYTVVAHGTLDPSDAYPFAVRVFIDNGDGDQYVDLVPKLAEVRVIHTSYDAPAVDVLVDDGAPAAVAGLTYGESSGYLDLEPGTRAIKVVAAGTVGPAVIETDLSLAPGLDYTIFAVDQLAMITAILDTDARTPDPAMARLRFVHASPDAPSVDIKTGSGSNPAVFGNRSFASISAYSTLAAGDYNFVVTAVGDTNAVVKFAPVTLQAGTVYTVVAHGTFDTTDAYPFAARVFVDNDPGDTYVDLVVLPPSAKVRVIHGSYDAPNVDVLIDDATPPAIANLAYRASSGYAEIPVGNRNVKVVANGTTSPVVIEANLNLLDNTDYTVFAFDELALIEAAVQVDARVPLPSQAKVRFVHASPDAPSVDIKVTNGSGPAVFTNRAFKSISDYTAVTPGEYVFAVTATGDTAEVARFESVTLAAATVYTIVAFGTLDTGDAYPFGVRVLIDSGTGDQFVDLIVQSPRQLSGK